MSLYGALFTGVSGLNAQGQKIGIISDNIANVNTVGYKQSKASFESLVVNAATSSAYSPGGVRNNTVQDIDKQGILSSTSAPTDIALSGSGFFVVSAQPTGGGQTYYTRAGSFRQDNLGNFQNANGFYLKGWPLDREGRLPGEAGNLNTISSANLESLEVVNVEAGSGNAMATSEVKLGINLNVSEKVYPGPKGTVTMDKLSPNNYGISSTDIIAPDEGYTPFVAGTPSFGLATANNIVRGDKFTAIATDATGSTLNYDYEYGGFTIGRSVLSNVPSNIGDNAIDQSPVSLPAGDLDSTAGSNTITVDLATMFGAGIGATLSVGQQFRLSGVTMGAGSTLSSAQLNGVQTITAIVGDVISFAVPNPAETVTTANLAGGTFSFRTFQGGIMDATSASQAFLGTTGLSGFTTAARSFTISTPSSGSHTFTYVASSPNPQTGQFNSLNSLAEAINQANGLTARVVDGRLMAGSEDATEAVTFANVDDAGNSTLKGLDWVTELGLSDITASARRFSTMANLAALVEEDAGVTATIENPLGDSTMAIANDDPLGTIQFRDYASTPQTLPVDPINVTAVAAGVATVTVSIPGHTYQVGDNIVLSGLTGPISGITATEINQTFRVTAVAAGQVTIQVTTAAGAVGGPGGGAAGTYQETNIGSILSELGLTKSLNGGAYVRGDTGVLGPQYDAGATVGLNMASGDIVAQFSRTTTIYDALGTGHDVRFSYLKIDENKWALEIHAVNPDDISSTLPDGQIAFGTIEFNGDGTLRTVSSSLTGEITVNWTNGSVPSEVSFNFGTAGQAIGTPGATQVGDTDGMRQFDSDYNVDFITQNGAPVGELVNVTIDAEGFVIASYSNGETQKLYKLPVADFTNVNGLKSESGNVFTQTRDSGEVNLREAGTNGTGKVVSSALEQSNVDLAEQLTDMIVAQRAYQANTRVISTSDELLEQLNQL